MMGKYVLPFFFVVLSVARAEVVAQFDSGAEYAT